SFHLPPMAARAAVSGQPPIAFCRAGRGRLPRGAFLLRVMARTTFVPRRGARPADGDAAPDRSLAAFTESTRLPCVAPAAIRGGGGSGEPHRPVAAGLRPCCSLVVGGTGATRAVSAAGGRTA